MCFHIDLFLTRQSLFSIFKISWLFMCVLNRNFLIQANRFNRGLRPLADCLCFDRNLPSKLNDLQKTSGFSASDA